MDGVFGKSHWMMMNDDEYREQMQMTCSYLNNLKDLLQAKENLRYILYGYILGISCCCDVKLVSGKFTFELWQHW